MQDKKSAPDGQGQNRVVSCDDYVTLVRAAQGVNKQFYVRNGTLQKSSGVLSSGVCMKMHVPDLAALCKLLAYTSADPTAVLILGYIPDAPMVYQLATAKQMIAWTGAESGAHQHNGQTYYARVKSNYQHSRWILFDYDQHPDDQLHIEDVATWRNAWAAICPELATCGMVHTVSGSSRVLHNGAPIKPVPNRHIYVQVQDAEDVPRFGQMLFLHALKNGMGWNRALVGGGLRRQTIFDPTTFSPERVVYAGAPIVDPACMALTGNQAQVIPGPTLNTRALANVTDVIDGLRAESIGSSVSLVDLTTMQADQLIDTADGAMTFTEYADSDLGKIRCQTPFRDSDSMAAYLNRHQNDEPFLYDVGTNTKYLCTSPDFVLRHILQAPPTQTRPAAEQPTSARRRGAPSDELRAVMDQLEVLIQRLPPISAERETAVHEYLTRLLDMGPLYQESYVPRILALLDWSRSTYQRVIRDVQRQKWGTALEDGTLPAHKSPIMDWPDVSDKNKPLATYDNAAHMIELLEMTSQYNEMTDYPEFGVPWVQLSESNPFDGMLCEVTSICEINGVNEKKMFAHVVEYARRNTYSPVRDWVDSVPWDGVSRFDTLVASMDAVNAGLARKFLWRWMISAIQVVYSARPSQARGVLILQGPQYVGKSRWLQHLCPEGEMFGGGKQLDPHKKDSLLSALRHWITELGEVDGTLRKADVEALKAFISQEVDYIRKPYDRGMSRMPRRTVFCATVNPVEFLSDPTGNSRYWSVPVRDPQVASMPDMQQMWAEILHAYRQGEQGHLTKEEYRLLNITNEQHTIATAAESLILNGFDWSAPPETWTMELTAVEVLERAGYKRDRVNRGVLLDASAALRKLTKAPGRRTGRGYIWSLPPLNI